MVNQPGNYIDFSGQRKKDRQVLLNISRKLNAWQYSRPVYRACNVRAYFFRSTADKYTWLFIWGP